MLPDAFRLAVVPVDEHPDVHVRQQRGVTALDDHDVANTSFDDLTADAVLVELDQRFGQRLFGVILEGEDVGFHQIEPHFSEPDPGNVCLSL